MALSFTLGPVDTSREATNVSQLCWRPDGNSLIVLSYSSLSLSSIASVLVLVWLTHASIPPKETAAKEKQKNCWQGPSGFGLLRLIGVRAGSLRLACLRDR